MKKLLCLSIASLFLFALTASAQITKGSLLLGGGISGTKRKTTSNSQDETTSNFSFYPSIGIAVKENKVVGLRLSYYQTKYEEPYGNYTHSQRQKGYSAGIFYRRYMNLSKRFYLFGEGAAYYSYEEAKTEDGNVNPNLTMKSNIVGINFYPGVAFAVNKRIHLEIGLNDLFDLSYSKSKTETAYSNNTTNTSTTSGFSVTTNVSTSNPLQVGFRFVFGK